MSDASPTHPRVSTGVAALDRALGGGLPALRATLVTGNAGAGKTTLALQFLNDGISRGEAGIFIALDQKPSHVVEAAAAFGWPSTGTPHALTVLDGSPAMTLMRQGQHALEAREVMSDLLPHIRAREAKRLVIDALPALVPPNLADAAEIGFLRDLVFALEDNVGCTTLLVGCDSDPRAARISAAASRLATGVIDVRVREEDGRLLRHVLVRKMRAMATDPVEQAFEIGPAGVVIDQV